MNKLNLNQLVKAKHIYSPLNASLQVTYNEDSQHVKRSTLTFRTPGKTLKEFAITSGELLIASCGTFILPKLLNVCVDIAKRAEIFPEQVARVQEDLSDETRVYYATLNMSAFAACMSLLVLTNKLLPNMQIPGIPFYLHKMRALGLSIMSFLFIHALFYMNEAFQPTMKCNTTEEGNTECIHYITSFITLAHSFSCIFAIWSYYNFQRTPSYIK